MLARTTQTIAKSARGLHTAAARSMSGDGHAHKVLYPPYKRGTTGLIMAVLTFGSFGAIWSSVVYQQKKGGFWYKEEKKQ